MVIIKRIFVILVVFSLVFSLNYLFNNFVTAHNEDRELKNVEKFEKKTQKELEKLEKKALKISDDDDDEDDDEDEEDNDEKVFRIKNEGRNIFNLGQIKNSLTINPNGNIVFNNGNIESIGTNSFTAKIWGITYTVNVSSLTQIIDAANIGVSLSISDFKVGDKVDVRGATTESSPTTIDAKVVRNRSGVSRGREDAIVRIQRQIDEFLRRINELLGITSPTPTPTTSATPTPTATPSPTVTPSPTPTATPSPTATPTATPSPTPTP